MRRSRESDQAAGVLGVRRALASRITPGLCAVAVKVDKPVLWTRYLFDVEPTEGERALAEAAGDEVAARLGARWLSQVLLRSVASDGAWRLEPGEEWAYTRTPASAPDGGGSRDERSG